MREKDRIDPMCISIDFHEAFLRFGSDTTLFSRVLDDFFGQYGKTPEGIMEGLTLEGREGTLKYVHGIKGVAAILGFDSLCQALHRTENLLQEADELSANQLQRQMALLSFQISAARKCTEDFLELKQPARKAI